MSKHTPGKWETVPKGHALTGVIFAGVEYICTLDESERVPVGSPEYMANARLIAAAPEMYELLKEAKEANLLTSFIPWDRIAELIAKIEGT